MKLKPAAAAMLLAVVFLGLTVVMKVAERNGLIAGDVGDRAFMVLMGLIIAGYGNVVPKQLKRPRATPEAEARVQAALRVCGWVMTLAGLVVAGIWTFAPEAVAEPVSLLTLGAAFLVVVFYALRCRKPGSPALARL